MPLPPPDRAAGEGTPARAPGPAGADPAAVERGWLPVFLCWLVATVATLGA